MPTMPFRQLVRGLHDGIGIHRLHNLVVERVRLVHHLLRVEVFHIHARALLLRLAQEGGFEGGVRLGQGRYLGVEAQQADGSLVFLGLQHAEHALDLRRLLAVLMLADALVGGELRIEQHGGLALVFDGRGLVGDDDTADGAHSVVAHLVRVGQLGGGDVGALAVDDAGELADGLAVGGLQRLDVEFGRRGLLLPNDLICVAITLKF